MENAWLNNDWNTNDETVTEKRWTILLFHLHLIPFNKLKIL